MKIERDRLMKEVEITRDIGMKAPVEHVQPMQAVTKKIENGDRYQTA